MKIAYISTSIIPSRLANSIHVMKMCQAFAKNGHKVVLLAPDWKNEYELGVEDIYKFYGVSRCFEIRKLPIVYFKGNNFLYSIVILYALRFFKPDLVYSRFIFGSYMSALFGYYTIFESHVPIWHVSKVANFFFKRLIRKKQFKKLIVISRALKNKYLNLGYLCDSSIQVFPDGADEVKEQKVFNNWPGRKNALQIGYVGHLYPGKGVEIIAKVAPMMHDMDFHIIGGTEKDINMWEKKINVKNVIFHGFVHHREISRYLSKIDICLLPNQKVIKVGDWRSEKAQNISQYTSPLKLFEYMANKKAIIASDLSVLKEILNNNNSILVHPEDFMAWKNAILSLKDRKKRIILGEAAYCDFTEKYTWSRRANNILENVVVL
jgi:glycosyltransferase involved in cell wall biosynthesis